MVMPTRNGTFLNEILQKQPKPHPILRLIVGGNYITMVELAHCKSKLERIV